MTHKLFIIGNGFDLHHGIPSRYSDFGTYVEAADPAVARLINDYLFVDENFWNCFEERLATFDSDLVIDHAEQFLMPYSAEDWSDAYHHDFEYEIGEVVRGLSNTMRSRFAEWIRMLPIPVPGAAPTVRCIDLAATFLTFNYTPTLQQLYGVPDDQVLHIHGRAADPDSAIVLGHGWERRTEEMMTPAIDENTDTRVAEGYHLIDGYFADTFKPTAQILAQNRTWFDRLAGVSDVWVLGHSLADVDAAYLHEIAHRVAPSTRWTVSYHGNDSHARAQIASFGVAANLATYAPLASL
ncbi:MAG: bacteriophage abortive infection AbiH family protein [Rhodobacteraceae bacterium]|nr:bacteriophage abortive infection AbiH family protein [Paracoccaceae bacterium]